MPRLHCLTHWRKEYPEVSVAATEGGRGSLAGREGGATRRSRSVEGLQLLPPLDFYSEQDQVP